MDYLVNNYYLILSVSGLTISYICFYFYKTKVKTKHSKQIQAIPTETLKEIPAEVIPVKPIIIENWQSRLQKGLKRTQNNLVLGIHNIFLSKDIKNTREEIIEQLYAALIQADLGVSTTELLISQTKDKITPEIAANPQAIQEILKDEIFNILNNNKPPTTGTIENPTQKPHVVLIVGVNGVGKTTTTGKLANKAVNAGQKVIIGAADTFRAAAVEQLKIWAERSGAEFISLKEGSDPASVAYEAVKAANNQNAELCLIDTAGRLHNRNDLMQELAKIKRVISKDIKDSPHEVLLVLDSTTGQNGLQQAKTFCQIVNVTGLILTKLDGTAKGGIAITISNELKIPIRYIGVGESVADLDVFSPREFVDALFKLD